MGRVSIEKWKQAMEDHKKSSPFKFRLDTFGNLFRDSYSRFSLDQMPIILNSMFPSLFDGIRLGRPQGLRDQTRAVCVARPPSDSRIIPIRVEPAVVHSPKCQALRNVTPIVLDDDVVADEVVEVITDDENSSSRVKHRERFFPEIKDSPIILDDDCDLELLDQACASLAVSKHGGKNKSLVTPLLSTPGKKSSPLKCVNNTLPSPSKYCNLQEKSLEQNKIDSANEVIITDNFNKHKEAPSDMDTGDYEPSSSHITSDGVCVSATKFPACHLPQFKYCPPPISSVYEMLSKKLKQEERKIHYITGDGNCFFRALSKALLGSEDQHSTVRRHVINVVVTNYSKFVQFLDGEDPQDHVAKMSEDGCWATTCEIYAAATFLQRDIYVLTPSGHHKDYSWLLFKPVLALEPKTGPVNSRQCYLTLCNTNGIHYDLVLAEHGKCNCFLPQPQLGGISATIDLT